MLNSVEIKIVRTVSLDPTSASSANGLLYLSDVDIINIHWDFFPLPPTRWQDGLCSPWIPRDPHKDRVRRQTVPQEKGEIGRTS